MPSKRSLIVALVGLNLFLLAALILSSYSPPAAYAQRIGGAGNFVAVTAEADEAYDALYLVDLPNRTLHVYIPARDNAGKLEYAGSRDLQRDFRGAQ